MHIVYNENCLETMKRMPDNSVDSIVTDPPYGLGDPPDPYEVMKSWLEHGYHEVKGKGFMAKEWDAFVPQPVIWKECFRILKPGGHLLAFSSPRTQDWMTMALRFAGFEINTSIYWVFASGMPKGLNVSKAIDKKYGLERDVVGKYTPPNGKDWNLSQATNDDEDAAPGTFTASGRRTLDITVPKHPDAKKWDGWNSQIKPAAEPITVARKPIIGNIVDNVLEHGTGTFNVDACRVGLSGARNNGRSVDSEIYGKMGSIDPVDYDKGRYPSNLIHDGSDDVVDLFPDTKSGKDRNPAKESETSAFAKKGIRTEEVNYGDQGSAARFYYCAKAGKSDRDEGLDAYTERASSSMPGRRDSDNADWNTGNDVTDRFVTNRKNYHPTAKPTALMRYLCRLVTPVGGLVYDPFSGSGSTGKAAILEGFEFVGSELDAGYADIANARLKHALENKERLVDEYVLEHVEKVMPKKSGYADSGYF